MLTAPCSFTLHPQAPTVADSVFISLVRHPGNLPGRSAQGTLGLAGRYARQWHMWPSGDTEHMSQSLDAATRIRMRRSAICYSCGHVIDLEAVFITVDPDSIPNQIGCQAESTSTATRRAVPGFSWTRHLCANFIASTNVLKTGS